MSVELRIGASERCTPAGPLHPGMAPQDAAHSAQLHVLRASDYRRAHAAATLSTGVDSGFLKLRTLISLGHLDEAQRLADSLRDSDQAALAAETCRLHAVAGRWRALLDESAILLATRDHDLALSTRLGLHQLRSLAYYESGEFAFARAELRAAMAFVEIVPSLPPSFYCAILERKLLLQERQAPLTDGELVQLWRARDSSPDAPATLDQVLTYLRLKLESEARRARPDSDRIATLALACAMTAQALGDSTFQALGWLALLPLADSPESRERCRQEISRSDRATTDAALLAGGGPLSQTLTLIAGLGQLPPARLARILPLEHAKHLWIAELELAIDLERRLCTVSGTKQETQVLTLLAANEQPSLPKAELFRRLWGTQAYSARLHDPVIATCLYRMRQKHGLEIRAKAETILLPRVVLA